MASTGKKVGIAAAVLFGVPILGFVAVFNYKDCKSSRTTIEYHVPKGYRGWVAIRYGVAAAPAIPFTSQGLVGGTYVINIPSSGYLETSSPVYPDFHQEAFYAGDRPMGAPGDFHATDVPCEVFWVGHGDGPVINREVPDPCK